MRKITIIIALLCLVAAPPCFGQEFLKKALEKVEKGMNKVNESLESTQRSTDPKSKDVTKASEKHKPSNVITPYISDQTKTIYLNKGKMSVNYDYNHFTDFSDGVAFFRKTSTIKTSPHQCTMLTLMVISKLSFASRSSDCKLLISY